MHILQVTRYCLLQMFIGSNPLLLRTVPAIENVHEGESEECVY